MHESPSVSTEGHGYAPQWPRPRSGSRLHTAVPDHIASYTTPHSIRATKLCDRQLTNDQWGQCNPHCNCQTRDERRWHLVKCIQVLHKLDEIGNNANILASEALLHESVERRVLDLESEVMRGPGSIPTEGKASDANILSICENPECELQCRIHNSIIE